MLSPGKRQPFRDGSGRLELTHHIASPANPLTARTAVNRVWLHHLGEGLVATPDDLGTMSGTPSHPELLDSLAARFVESGWSLKKPHKLIVLSSADRQVQTNGQTFFLFLDSFSFLRFPAIGQTSWSPGNRAANGQTISTFFESISTIP